MSAPPVHPPDCDSKECQVCGATFTRNVGVESVARFAARKYCGRVCMGIARRHNPRETSVATQKRAARRAVRGSNPGFNTAPPPVPPRIERGTWRPNAPGWPAQPHIPARLVGAAR